MKRSLSIAAILFFATSLYAAQELRKSTAISVTVGPLFASSDHTTLATSIDAAEWTCTLFKGTSHSHLTITASGGDNDAAFIDSGCASLELTAGNTDTYGLMRLVIKDPNNDYITEYFTILDPNEWDRRYSTGEINVYSVGGVKVAAADPCGAVPCKVVYVSQSSNATTSAENATAVAAAVPTRNEIKAAIEESLPADVNTVPVADAKIAATATVDTGNFAADLLDTVIYGHKVSWYLYQLGIPIGRNGKGVQNPPE